MAILLLPMGWVRLLKWDWSLFEFLVDKKTFDSVAEAIQYAKIGGIIK